MRNLILLGCVLISASALKQELIDDLMSKMQEHGIECSETEKATEADMEALINKQSPVTHEGKCVIFCIAKKMNLMHPDGTIGEGYVEWLNKAKADDIDFYTKLMDVYHDCEEKVQPEEDHCEYAAKLATCSLTEGRKAGLNNLF